MEEWRARKGVSHIAGTSFGEGAPFPESWESPRVLFFSSSSTCISCSCEALGEGKPGFAQVTVFLGKDSNTFSPPHQETNG